MGVLEKLGEDSGRVLHVTLAEDKKTVELLEACNMYFSVDFDKKDFGQFISELQDIHKQML